MKRRPQRWAARRRRYLVLVRYSVESGHPPVRLAGPLCANWRRTSCHLRIEAASGGGLPSPRGRLDVRCNGRQVRRRACPVHLQFKISRFVQESCGNLGVRCCFSQPKQDRRLTHEILFSDHVCYPRGIPAPTPLRASRGIRSGELCYKVNFIFSSIL